MTGPLFGDLVNWTSKPKGGFLTPLKAEYL